KKNIELTHLQSVKLKDIAFLAAPEQDKKDLEDTHIYRISKEDNNIVVIDSFLIIEHLNKWYEHLEFQLIGPTQTIIRLKENKQATPVLLASLVWLLLFVGAAMTIMTFHYDVSMTEVQPELRYLFTGAPTEVPIS